MTDQTLEPDASRSKRGRIVLIGGTCLLAWIVASAAFWAPRIERELGGRATEALAARGIAAEPPAAHGRELVLSGPIASAAEAEAARRALEGLPGVRRVEVRFERPSPPAAPAIPSAPPAKGDAEVVAAGEPAGFGEGSAAETTAETTVAVDGPEAAVDPGRELAELVAGGAIEFERYGEELTPAAVELVGRIAAFLERHPEVRLEIAGHTDARGPLDRNLEISRRRAEAVRSRLVEAGVAAERLEATGYGPERPIADNSTEEGRRTNRRVELTILERG